MHLHLLLFQYFDDCSTFLQKDCLILHRSRHSPCHNPSGIWQMPLFYSEETKSADTEIHRARSAPLNSTKLKQETEGCLEVRIYMNCYCYPLSPMYISHTRALLLLKNIKLLKTIYAHSYP